MSQFAETFLSLVEDREEIRLLTSVGNVLNNLHGSNINEEMLEEGNHEVVLFLQKGDKVCKINLADLFELAMKGANQTIKYRDRIIETREVIAVD